MEFFGYISLIVMGIILGIMGAGGSILTIPILIYLLGTPILLATSYSLILVGTSALISSIYYRNCISFRKAIHFAIPSIVGVFTTRDFIIPSLSNYLGTISTDKALIVLLLIFIGISGYFMIRNSAYPHDAQINPSLGQYVKVTLIALSLGIVMGLLGAGGGFLIVPTFVLFMGFSMQEAVPTSLLIITMNSFMGFAADKHNFLASDWLNISKYLSFTCLGTFMGIYIAKFINSNNLKKSFGYFVWIIGITIFAKECIL
jgi:hypothetical protein